MWSIPLPAGEPRRLGNIEGQYADFLSDGRIVFSNTKELYIGDRDGSNPRKLYSGAGGAWNPAVSPDGRRVAFTTTTAGLVTLAEIASDGTNFRILLQGACCARWSPDGNYLVYRIRHGGTSDIWALPMQTGLFGRSQQPIRLTNGPLACNGVTTGRDGKEIFAIGTKRHGELVRYDVKSHQFVPFLSGISAIDPTFSSDGQWVTYISYPDHTLWRSRSDGSERMQLTYPPMEAAYPSISPDGTKVAFSNFDTQVFGVALDGGPPQKIVEKNSGSGNWSPDGNLLVVVCWSDGPASERPNSYLQVFDLRTGKFHVVPDSHKLSGAHWIDQDTLVATNRAGTKFLTFDFKSQKWSDLVAVNLATWNLSTDRKYVYFTTGGTEPEARRLRVSDRQIETIASLKGFRRVIDMMQVGRVRLNVAPDGSPVFTRDIGSQEIYALSVHWP
jgi:Tol biopolymer transport system component